jgi:hypothetical protein
MSIKNRNTLKAEFVSGTAATSSKFDDIFDSHFNKYEDSVLAGPLGLTGTNGLVGPAGATFYNGLVGPAGATFYTGLIGPGGATSYIGLWLDSTSAIPAGYTANGATGQVIIGGTAMYICTSTNNWLKFIGSTGF